MSPLPAWSHTVADIPDGGFARERAATADERAEIAAALGLLSLGDLKSAYRIDRLAGGGYRLHGKITADLEQACVVTLDAVPEHIDERFDTEFWPGVAPAGGEHDASVIDGRDVEPLEPGGIATGRIVFETLSSALDPYPRKDGATFDWQDKAAAVPEKTSPFATLAKLKDKG